MQNAAQSTTAGAITTSSTSVSVQVGKGALFTSNQYATLYAAGTIELVLVGTISGDTLPITRAQGGTTAAAWASGTTILQGANGPSMTSLMNSVLPVFVAGATLTTPAYAQFDPSADLHPVRKSWADANYYAAGTPYQTALTYVPVQKYWDTTHSVAIGWSGTNPYLVIDGVYQGVIYHSGNYTPSTKAALGATCNWNSGIVEIGPSNPGDPVPGQTTAPAFTDTSSPWVIEGMREDTTNWPWPYTRVVWLRNN